MTCTSVRTISNMGFVMCARECEAMPSCKGVNFHRHFLLCELLSPPLKGKEPGDGWIYAGNMTWLENNNLATGAEQIECDAWDRKVRLTSGSLHCSRNNLPADCQDKRINRTDISNGIYTISPKKNSVFDVYCDFESDGEPWTVIQARVDDSVNFNRTWAGYKVGFGNLRGNFWLGNDNIHSLVSDLDYTLRVDMEYFDGTKWVAKYNQFYVGNEDSNYTLHVGEYHGNAGNSLVKHNGMAFTTVDYDNDHVIGNCASGKGRGGWWYDKCFKALLNGNYYNKSILSQTEKNSGIHWFGVKNGLYSMKSVSMKVRKWNPFN